MADIIEYIIKLKDELSGTLSKIHHNTEMMNNKMRESTDVVGGLKRAFLEFFAAEKIFEFGKESVEAFEAIQNAQVQLQNALKNRDIGISYDELNERAEEYSRKWVFTEKQIYESQLALTNFKNVAGGMYDETEKAAINIASKTGKDGVFGNVVEISDTLGRALNAPQRAARLLRQFGVAFTDDQQKLVTKLSNTGHVMEAQKMILQELANTYKGAADAASTTADGQKALAEHGLEEVKEEFGEIIVSIQLKLIPYFRRMTDYIRSEILPQLKIWVGYMMEVVHWIKEHWQLVKIIGEIVIAYTVLMKTIGLVSGAMTGFLKIAEVNPYVLAIAGAIVLLGWINKIKNAQEDAYAPALKAARENEMKAVSQLAESWKKAMPGLTQEQAKQKAFLQENARLMEERNKTMAEWKGAAEYSWLKKDAGERLRIISEKWEALNSYSTNPQEKMKDAKIDNGVVPEMGKIDTATEKVTGTKNTVINITINKLVDSIVNNVTNLSESTSKIREEVVKALITAVNDSQIVAGG